MESEKVTEPAENPPIEKVQKTQTGKPIPLLLQAFTVLGMIYYMLLSLLFIWGYVLPEGLLGYINDYTSYTFVSASQIRSWLIPAILLQLIIITGAILILFRKKTGIVMFSLGSFINLLLLLTFMKTDWLNLGLVIIFVLLPLLFFRKISKQQQQYGL